MILNLVDNAVKADCEDIWIRGKQSKNFYQIMIKDNGKGIPVDELGRITEAFIWWISPDQGNSMGQDLEWLWWQRSWKYIGQR